MPPSPHPLIAMTEHMRLAAGCHRAYPKSEPEAEVSALSTSFSGPTMSGFVSVLSGTRGGEAGNFGGKGVPVARNERPEGRG